MASKPTAVKAAAAPSTVDANCSFPASKAQIYNAARPVYHLRQKKILPLKIEMDANVKVKIGSHTTSTLERLDIHSLADSFGQDPIFDWNRPASTSST
ncbi:hypothetical protein L2E82_27717 [Cichorium intybus]|uniref:Uncharacterized protein n=1 Tax=Cichorium intybus TaxID=13427 RepID=A0ACB9CTS9_CICIN|nr:hypothetical protein L2E82_27717 [Cichorium intybus]